jgi:hypothetical protein
MQDLSISISCTCFVDIESLSYNLGTMLLKMHMLAESGKLVFAEIIRLDPNLELGNDIIEMSVQLKLICLLIRSTS